MSRKQEQPKIPAAIQYLRELHSQPASPTLLMRDELHDNLLLAFSAIKNVKRDLTYGAANRPDSTDIAKNKLWYARFYARFFYTFYSGFGIWPTPFGLAKTKAITGKLYGVGNCGEQASMAFFYLCERHVQSLELMFINNGDHAFVVLGRKSDSNISDYTTWGEHAVVCDPWANRYYPASDLQFQLNDLLTEAGCSGFNPISQTIVRECLAPKVENTPQENMSLAENLRLSTEDTQKLYAQFTYFLTLKKRYSHFGCASNFFDQISLATGIMGIGSCLANFLHIPRVSKTTSIMMFTTAVATDGMKRMLGTAQLNNLEEQHNLWRK